MNLQSEHIGQLCRQLKLERVLAEYAAVAQGAVRDEASFTDFLEKVLKAESDFRTERTRQMLAKLAGFPSIKTLEDFDFGFAVGAPKVIENRPELRLYPRPIFFRGIKQRLLLVALRFELHVLRNPVQVRDAGALE